MAETNVDHIGNTAFIIAQWRDNESNKSNPLYHDTIANIFIPEKYRNLAAQISKASPSTELLVNLRTKYFDDILTKHIENGTRQIVILGAGFDTRSIRLGTDNVKFFEIDKKEVLQFKSQKLRSFGYTENSIYITCDYLKFDFISEMIGKGFDPAEDTFFLWEGNTMYLSYEDIVELLKLIKRSMSNFYVSFDYLSKKLLHAKDLRKNGELLDQFNNMGAPWRTGFDDIVEVAKKSGLRLLENSLIIDCIDGYSINEYMNDYSVCIMAQTI